VKRRIRSGLAAVGPVAHRETPGARKRHAARLAAPRRPPEDQPRMRTLYHFPTSPFSRRVRLAFAHKGLPLALRDARNDPDAAAELPALSALGRIPLLVDGDLMLADSRAILQWLDATHPEPPLWPRERGPLARALGLVVQLDGAIDVMADLGTRLFELADHPAWPAVRDRALGRARGALQTVADVAAGRVGRPLVGDTWGAVDMAVLIAVLWMEGLPARAVAFPPAARIVALGVELPAALVAWADPHRAREDVLALDAG
jgi:glutathione S-transferase